MLINSNFVQVQLTTPIMPRKEMSDPVRRGTFLMRAASHHQHLTVEERSSSSMVMSRCRMGTVKVEY